MFDVGFWELVILFGLGLMILGPERMPMVASKLGRWVGQARNMARHLTSQIRDEIEPIESSIKSMNQSANETMKKDFSSMRPEPGQAANSDETPTTTASATPASSSADSSTDSSDNASKPPSAAGDT